MPISTIDLICHNCGKKFVRSLSEHKRCQQRGMKSFCSRSCACAHGNKTTPHGSICDVANLHAGNRRDDFTPFRWFMLRVRCRGKHSNRKRTDFDLAYLKRLWENQNGRCPLTGWKLRLPDSANGWHAGRHIKNASLDRIDNAQGYTRGNVRFVSVVANMMRGQFTDDDLVGFCQAVAQHMSAEKEKEQE